MLRFALLLFVFSSMNAFGQQAVGSWPEGGGPLTVSFLGGNPVSGVRFYSEGNYLSTGSDPSPFSFFVEGSNQSGLGTVSNGSLDLITLTGSITLDVFVASDAPPGDILGELGTRANVTAFPVERIVPEPTPNAITCILFVALYLRRVYR